MTAFAETKHLRLPLTSKGPVVLITGGTGGHVMPAVALAQALTAQGHQTFFMIDKRAQGYLTPLPQSSLVLPLTRIDFTSWHFWKSFIQSFKKSKEQLKNLSPSCVIAFGGYCSLPAALAAIVLKIPLYLHEQNAVLGKAHRFLLPFAKKLFLSFSSTARIPLRFLNRCLLTGMPVRSTFYASFPDKVVQGEGSFRILVLGGSQGTSFFSYLLPKALILLPTELQRKIKIQQQCRPEIHNETTQAYKNFQGHVTLAAFYEDIGNKMKEADLIISRAGSSTLAELMVLEKKALFVPLKSAIYDHQTANAYAQCAKGGGWTVSEDELTPSVLADFIRMQYNTRHSAQERLINFKQQPEKTIIDCLRLLI